VNCIATKGKSKFPEFGGRIESVGWLDTTRSRGEKHINRVLLSMQNMPHLRFDAEAEGGGRLDTQLIFSASIRAEIEGVERMVRIIL
jgi:hypothetical protein